MPPGRRMGRAGLMEQQRKQEAMAKRGEQIAQESLLKMRTQLEQFKQHLSDFATAHKKEIQNDAAFRSHFHTMCAQLGVDPLTSRKGIWSEILGVGDYYYSLGIRIIERCVATRHVNGGIIALHDLTAAMGPGVSSDDVVRAVQKLSELGKGFKVVEAGDGVRFIQSVPKELSPDHTAVLALCNKSGDGFVTKEGVEKALAWSAQRVESTLEYLLQSEFAWIDTQGAQHQYWIVGLLSDLNDSESSASKHKSSAMAH